MEGPPRIPANLDPGIERKPIYGPIRLDLSTQTLQSIDSDKTEKLTPKEYQMLWMLVRAQGGIISGSEMDDFQYQDLPDDTDVPLNSSINVYIYKLRKKLEKVASGKISIENDRGMGFKLVLAKESKT